MPDRTMINWGVGLLVGGLIGVIIPSTPMFSLFMERVPSLLIYSLSAIAFVFGIAFSIKGRR